MKLAPKQAAIILGAVFFIIVLAVVIFIGGRRSGTAQKFTLTVWGFDKSDAMQSIIEGYKKMRPNATVNYVQVPEAGYDDLLLNALAAGTGPDVFPIGNRDLPKQKDKLLAADPSQMPLVKFRNLFPQVAEDDFVSDGKIYALPLYIDTLALIYNRDIFDQAAIVSPPSDWTAFQKIVPSLRVLNPQGQIVRAAAAIGGSESTVDSATDLLELLMMQNGAQMTDAGHSYATFAGSASGETPGLAAFKFYLSFANAGLPYYTWNENENFSLDNFAGGGVAMIFDYYSSISQIKAKSPFLNFGIAPMIQPAGSSFRLDYAKYTGLAVSKQSQNPTWAWDYILYLASMPDVSSSYLQAAGRPPALRSLIDATLNDPNLGVFARQALTARSWYQADSQKINDIMNSAVKSALTGVASPATALAQAQDRITQLMR
jgi:multiple sugar transport system substrate-binding protein